MGAQHNKDIDPEVPEETIFNCCGSHRDSRMLTQVGNRDSETGAKQHGILKNKNGTTESERDPSKISIFKSTFLNAYYPGNAQQSTTTFGPGIRWVTRKGNLIVAGFLEGSLASVSGVLVGDILKAVDGTNVLLVKSETKPPSQDDEAASIQFADKQMSGRYKSSCSLEFLRASPDSTQGSAAKPALMLATFQVPRCCPC